MCSSSRYLALALLNIINLFHWLDHESLALRFSLGELLRKGLVRAFWCGLIAGLLLLTTKLWELQSKVDLNLYGSLQHLIEELLIEFSGLSGPPCIGKCRQNSFITNGGIKSWTRFRRLLPNGLKRIRKPFYPIHNFSPQHPGE